jgi:hypothetical protein
MFQKSIETIIAQGVRDLEALTKQTRQAADEARIKVSQCQSEIQSLVTLAKQVPEKVFDRYSNVLVGTFFVQQFQDESTQIYCEMRIGSIVTQLRGLMGDEKIKLGKYRVIVLLEPIS